MTPFFKIFLGARLILTRQILTCLVFTYWVLNGSISVADTSKSQVGSFKALKEIVLGFQEPGATLVVMDDDDTLTMMPCSDGMDSGGCQYLGGPAWYAWQAGLIGSGSPYSAAKTQDELLNISALLFAMNKMAYTEDDLAAVLNSLALSGVRLLVLTARGGSTVSATEMQLENLTVPGSGHSSFLDLIRSNALVMGDIPSLPGPFVPCSGTGARKVTYQQGVMYVAGQNKGLMLKCLLQYYGRLNSGKTAAPVKNIVFIDDTQENVDDVYRAFKSSPGFQVKALHYTALDDHKQALTKEDSMGKRLRDKAKERWDAICLTLSRQLLSPATGN